MARDILFYHTAMKKIKDLFDAQASSPYETAMLHNGAVGFRIPEYQREYDWSRENITRLFSDCLSGFHRLAISPNADAFTFLGTLILVEERTKEEDFAGTSVAIVDGQQRLTTLTLLACALFESLNVGMNKIEALELKKKVRQWIEAEIEDHLADLLDCAAGTQKVKGNRTYPYPRIVRVKDFRGRSAATSEYYSPLGIFLDAFAKYASNEISDEFLPPSLGSGKDAQHLGQNFSLVRRLVNDMNDSRWYEDEECEQVSISWLDRSGYKNLLDRLADFNKDQRDQSKAIDELIKCKKAHNLVRTLLFAAYFCRCIVLTRVTTDDESAAFDIFDALNTTGEPLTALETLKPRVIRFEESKGGFSGSQSDAAFLRLKEYVDEQHNDTSRKQKDTKELLVSFALYIEGTKLPEHLARQRQFLRTRYDKATAVSRQNAQRFVHSLANIAEFRRFYWTSNGIEELARFHVGRDVDEVQLLMSFIKDTRAKLALPVLARYWSDDLKNQGSDEFLEALKAVTAFLVLRRAASGGTAGIDSDFRAVMAPTNGSSKRFGLCAGVDSENQKPSIDELKTAFRKLLAESKFRIEKKSKWVDQVIDNPLYRQANKVARFMLLAAAHQASPSATNPGCWKKEGVKSSAHHNNFLTYHTWNDELYETIEHIAPESEPREGWDNDIYKNTILRDSLGNLILLPRKENGAIGNGSWRRKKVFYCALTELTEDQQRTRINEAAALGMIFSDYTKQLLGQNRRLSLLDPLRDVEHWNCEVIEARARNTAALTWDYLWPWLN